jgi:hypothetical protein
MARTKKNKKKDCPEGHSMQSTGKKDPRTGKDIMKCQLDIRGKEGPNKDKEDPKKPTEPTGKKGMKATAASAAGYAMGKAFQK